MSKAGLFKQLRIARMLTTAATMDDYRKILRDQTGSGNLINGIGAVLVTLTQNILKCISVNIPIDTGLMVSSLYVKPLGLTGVEIGIDCSKCPYAPWVEIRETNHPHGGISHFMDTSAKEGIEMTKHANIYNVSTDIQPGNNSPRLAIIINIAGENNISEYVKPNEEGAAKANEAIQGQYDILSQAARQAQASGGGFGQVMQAYQGMRQLTTGKRQHGIKMPNIPYSDMVKQFSAINANDPINQIAAGLGVDPRRLLVTTLPNNFLPPLFQAALKVLS